MTITSTDQNVVVVNWEDVINATKRSDGLMDALKNGFGPQGVGLVAIRGVPGFVKAKNELFPLAHKLVHLPPDYLEAELSDPATLYNAGWSHGKEKLGKDKPADFAKGSFYFNPITDTPGTEEDRAKYPLSYPANKWPSEDKMEGFKDAATKLGAILSEATIALSQHIDRFAEQEIQGYAPNFLHQALHGTEKVKGRLLYYFPLEKQETSTAEDSWIGWHNDSGFLTALAGDLYVDHSTGQIVECPDPTAGLYVVDRRNNGIQRVAIPPDCMAVQMGECTQIVTGGALAATPHCVRGCSNHPGIARISLACFIDTTPTFPLQMPGDGSDQDAMRNQVLQISNPRVPPLEQRWTKDGLAFGDFLTQTFSMYYSWTAPEKDD